MKVSISDSVYEKYGSVKRMEEVLEAVDGMQPEQYILIDKATRARIQACNGGVPLKSGSDVAALCERLSRIRLYGVDVQFDPDQLDRVKGQAEFYGKDINQYLSDQIRQHLEAYMLGV